MTVISGIAMCWIRSPSWSCFYFCKKSFNSMCSQRKSPRKTFRRLIASPSTFTIDLKVLARANERRAEMLIDARLKTISDLLSSQASNHKEQPYLLYQPTGQEISYQALDRLTLKTAELLLELGMAKGDRVGLMLDNSIEFLLAYLGVLRTGGVIVPLNPTSRPTEIYNVLSHCKAKTFITDTKHLADLSDLRSVLPTLDHIILSKYGFFEVPDRTTTLSSTLEMAALPTVGLDDPAVILYPSGTTGQTKGVVLTQLNLVVNACD